MRAREQLSLPNIVLILADDMGYGDFGFLNNQLTSTPALDELASESLVFTQHYSASPVCAPARAALLTGRYPQRTGVIDTLEARGTDRLSLAEVTLADALHACGYGTGLVGKWHTGAIGDAYAPRQRGFDEFVGFRGGWQDYWQWTLEVQGRRVRSDGRYLTDVLADESVEFIRRHAGEPFFLHVAFNAPHFPFQAPKELIRRHQSADRTDVVATIYAMIEVMDRGVGRIRQALVDAGISENTLLLFTSDNGPDHGGEGTLSAARFNAGLAGSKQYVYDGGIRLPLILHWPDGVSVGSTSQFAHFTDWYPTLLGVAEAENPGHLPIDGQDLRTVFAGSNTDSGPRFWQWTRYQPMLAANAAMRDGPWKLVHPALAGTLDLDPADERTDADIKVHPERYPEPVNWTPPDHAMPEAAPVQLFNISDDPEERQDVANQHPSVVSRMEADLSRWFESVEAERNHVSARPVLGKEGDSHEP